MEPTQTPNKEELEKALATLVIYKKKIKRKEREPHGRMWMYKAVPRRKKWFRLFRRKTNERRSTE